MARTPNEPQDPAPADARPRNMRVIEGSNVRYDLATEERLLSSLMADVTTWPAVEGQVRAEHFWDSQNSHIFSVIEGLHSQGRNPWPPQVIDELRQAGLLEVVGGAGGIEALANAYEPGGRQRSADDARLIAHYARSRRFLAVADDLKAAASKADHDGALALLARATEDMADDLESAPTWVAVDTAALLAGGIVVPKPTMLERSDGQFLIYAGKIHAFNAEPESGKSFLSVWLCAERIAAGEHVVYLDFEADQESVHERLLATGVGSDAAGSFFHYVRPDDPYDVAARARLLDLCRQFSPTVAIIDGVAEVMAMNGWDENSNTDIASFLNALPRLLERQGCAVVLIDHLVKAKESQGRYGRGGAHKLAGITVAYKLEVVRPFARGEVGMAKLIVTKDRAGWVRRVSKNSRVAEVELTSTDDGSRVVIELRAPQGGGEEVSWDGPTHCMESVLALLIQHPETEFSQRRIGTELRAKNLSYRHETIAEALSRLTMTQQIDVRNGPRASRLYRSTTSHENTLNGF